MISEPGSSRLGLAPLLQALSSRLAMHEAAQRERSAIEAPDFDPFIYVQPDEVGLSRMLRDLLDPRGTHAQGELFLGLFLESVGLPGLKGLERAAVMLESVTEALDSPRRIDVLIQGEDWVIGIENKPWASDQPQQVTDYLRELQNRGASRFHLLYLTRDASRPSATSIAKSECEAAIESQCLLNVSYATITEWLGACSRECRADRVKWFLEAFRRYIEQVLVGKRADALERIVVETVFDSSGREHLRSALALIQSRDTIRGELKTRLMSAIETRLPAGWSIHRNLATQGALGLKSPRSAGWHFCVEPQRKGDREWCYGVKYDDAVTAGQRRSIDQLGRRLRDKLPGGRQSAWWPYWRWFRGLGEHEPSEYTDWELSVQPWLDMDNGRMADHFVSLAGQFFAIASMQSDVIL